MRDNKVALVSLGCAKNLVDSEVMIGYLKKAGFKPVGSTDEADILIVNTCGFIQAARDEAEEYIQTIAALKREKPSLKTAVVGCYVERSRDDLKSRFPEIDIWMGVKSFDLIVDGLKNRPFDVSPKTFLYSHTSPRLVSTPGTWAYVKISEGCSHRCGFCSIPLIKGPYVSRSISSIEKEVRILSGLGVKEINLISHDTTYYGQDKNLQEGLVRLLDRLLSVKDIRWIRLLYGYPEEISDSLLEIMNEDKICSYLDIPFQHSDPGIVKAMKRGMDGARALKLLDKIRKKIPDIAFRTSLIVGFPGEAKKEFESLKHFVRAAKFDHLGVFTYSREEGTDSFGRSDSVPENEKEQRKREIMDIQADLSSLRNRDYVGRVLDVIIEGPASAGQTGWLARGRFQAPEVDGSIQVRAPHALRKPVGPLVRAKITAADIYDLKGRIVD